MCAETPPRARAIPGAPGSGRAGQTLQRFDADDRHDLARSFDPDQSRPRDRGMRVEDCLARDREKRLVIEDHPVRLASAEPESPLRVAIAQVAHAVIKRLALGVGDLGQARGVRTIKVLAGHHWPGNDDLADLAVGRQQVVRPDGDRGIADADHPGLDPHDRVAHADPHAVIGGAASFAQNHLATDRSDRQRLGRTVGRVELTRPVEERSQLFEDTGRHRGAGGYDPFQGRQATGLRLRSLGEPP